jgi:hypothetical protein
MLNFFVKIISEIKNEMEIKTGINIYMDSKSNVYAYNIFEEEKGHMI